MGLLRTAHERVGKVRVTLLQNGVFLLLNARLILSHIKTQDNLF